MTTDERLQAHEAWKSAIEHEMENGYIVLSRDIEWIEYQQERREAKNR